MERYVMNKLIEWKNKPGRKPLILKGARQVGKTWLMKEFGKRQFKYTAYVNFDNNDKMREVFEMDYNIERILMAINIETGVKILPQETLIIFDEIQEILNFRLGSIAVAVNDVELARTFILWQTELQQTTLPDKVTGGDLRNQGDAHTACHQIFDSLLVVDPGHHIQ